MTVPRCADTLSRSALLEWTDTLPLETEVKKNGTYCFFAKDKAGNISHEELEIITVDMKPPSL